MFNQNPHCGACGHMNMRGFCNLTACPFPFPTNTAIGSYEIKPKTNADHIRSMSDEELADYLGGLVALDCYACPLKPCDYEKECEKVWLDWLRKECDEADTCNNSNDDDFNASNGGENEERGE